MTAAIPVEHGGKLMKKRTLGVVAGTLMIALLGSSVARAGDVEVVNPNPAPPPQQVTTVPAAPPPVQPVAVEPVAPPVHKEVREDVQPPHNVMGTIAVSALMGGLAGLLVGGAIYYLGDHQAHAARIGYWAAGGVLLGTGVGIVQVVADESRADQAVSSVWSPDPARTYRVALFTRHF
jgi:hypothetical protein